jgi:hypothetical protein
MKYLLFILFSLLVYSCNDIPNSKKTLSSSDNSDKFFEIKYEDLLNKKQVSGLSQIASNVEYIQLETKKECLIRSVVSYFFTDSLIFIKNFDHILKFSRNGKFLKKIGNPGRGPGEIVNIRVMSIIPDKRLIIVQNNFARELLYFSFDGQLVKTITIPYTQYMKVLNDGRYFAYDDGGGGNEKYTFRLTNEMGDTISVKDNYTKWTNTNTSNFGISIGYKFEPFYLYRNNLFVKTMYNDTVYSIIANKIRPSYFINLGKYKLPDDLRLERLGPAQVKLYVDKSSDCYYGWAFQSSNKIFLSTYCYGKGDPKYLVYDIDNLKGNLLVNDTGISTGFVNDWDGGMDFWPIGSLSDNQVYMPINIMDFQKEFANKKSSQKSVKFPEKQSQLERQITGLEILNNPIIMVVTLKPNK